MRYIEIDTVQLNADIRELEQNTAKAKASLEAVICEMEELNAMWKGAANEAFQKQVAQDCRIMNTLISNMEKLADCMEHAGREYEKCEQAVKENVDRIAI